MEINYKGKAYQLPDVIIVGGAKCGTTSLFYYLDQHEQVFAPAEKEPHFFSFFNNKPNFSSPADLRTISNIDEYSKLFDKANSGQLLFEASTSYLFDYKTTISNIKEIYGSDYNKLKIIVLLRNPVDRAWSQYWQFKKFNHEPLSFEESILDPIVEKRLKENWNYYYDYLGFGEYYEQVKNYMDHFQDVKVFIQEDFLEDSSTVVKDCVQFLGLNESQELDTERKFNPSGGIKSNLFGFIWAIKTNSKLLDFLKHIFPLRVRKKIIYFFMEKALSRKTMPLKLKEKLIGKYLDGNNRLYNLLKIDSIKTWNEI
ncbi:MAG: hypothetical protein BM564_02260 [Bacteroidetes bacterium MedPE-SWsnd-G2]|nr:MAG: hypothetical protein BM564_02260 [Bacteroidetes bacterium MedPE-SWsnd-G2]